MIKVQGDGFEIDAAVVAEALGLTPEAVMQGIRDGTITTRSEHGEGEDAGRHRLTFFGPGKRLRLILDETGHILKRTIAAHRGPTPVPPPSGSFASPPCFLHELDPLTGGLIGAPDPVQARDVARWRKAERARLLAARAALPVATRQAAARAIASHLDGFLGDLAGKTVSAYWPIKSELDLRPWLLSLNRRGATACLPLVVEKAAPLRFRAWTEATPMERGIWDIAVPATGDWLVPDILIAPVVGHDAGLYRLGYGGGYFDRTLAAIGPSAMAIGIGLAASRVATIFAQPHDVAMRAIITEEGVLRG